MPIQVKNFLAAHKSEPSQGAVFALGEKEFEQAKNFVLRSLGKKNQTSHELKKKLKIKGFSEATIENICTWLEEFSLLDNQKFAQASLQSNLQQGKGSLAFCRSTRTKLNTCEQQQALSTIAEEQWVQAAVVAKIRCLRKYKNPEMTPELRQKLYRFLASRGFNHAIIMKAIAL